MSRIGILGGTFDPVHYGHLIAAEWVREELSLGRVLLVPTSQSPHKTDGAASSSRDRLAMLQFATAGHPALEPSDIEINRGGVSYTVDTLTTLRAGLGAEVELFFVMGADSLRDLPTWREVQRIVELAQIVTVTRPGHPVTDLDNLRDLLTADQLQAIREHIVEIPGIDLSSSGLRERVAAGKSIRFTTPRAVEEYIAEHGLYVH